MLETKRRSSVGEASAVHHGAASLPPRNCFQNLDFEKRIYSLVLPFHIFFRLAHKAFCFTMVMSFRSDLFVFFLKFYFCFVFRKQVLCDARSLIFFSYSSR